MNIRKPVLFLIIGLIATAFVWMAMDRLLVPDSQTGSPLSRTTEAGRYMVTIEPAMEIFNREEMHDWIIEIKTPRGEPVNGAVIVAGGGMPGHGHGLPTAPQMTAELGGGKYRFSGYRFNMAGRWVLNFTITSGLGEDVVEFDLDL